MLFLRHLFKSKPLAARLFFLVLHRHEDPIGAFLVVEGVRYVVHEVRLDGLSVLPVKKAREYFQPDKGLLGGGEARAYTPSRLNRAIDALRFELRQHGYAEAQVRAVEVNIDDHTGKVGLVIEVMEATLQKSSPQYMAALRLRASCQASIPTCAGGNGFAMPPVSVVHDNCVRTQPALHTLFPRSATLRRI